jgi:membrane fusion protein, multidrug efflux system
LILKPIRPKPLNNTGPKRHHLKLPRPGSATRTLGLLLLMLMGLISVGLSFAAAQDNHGDQIRVLVMPLVETTFAAEIAGRIEKITVDMGDNFKKGQDLVIFDCGIYKAQVDMARAVLKGARKTLEVNLRLERFKSISQVEVAVAEAQADQAKAELALKNIVVKKCALKAPFTGRVVKREANPFEYVTQGQPLLQVLDHTRLYLQLYVPSTWLKQAIIGKQFKVRLDETGKDYPAKITTLGARVDPVSQTLDVRAVIEGTHPELLAGMSGTARF